MQIEKIICKDLQGNLQENYQVFVKFDDKKNPAGVMCRYYDSKEKECSAECKPCIYSRWEKFK